MPNWLRICQSLIRPTLQSEKEYLGVIKSREFLIFPSHQSKSEDININFKFYQPGDAPAALTLRPDSFEPDEASAFQDLPPATQRLGWLSEPAYLNF